MWFYSYNSLYLGEFWENNKLRYRFFRKFMNILYDSNLEFMLVSILWANIWFDFFK